MRFPLLVFLLLAGLSGANAEDIRVFNIAADPPVETVVSGDEAAKLLKAFESLEWDGTSGARCHKPGFRLVAPAEGEPRLDATICFACSNVRFTAPAGKPQAGFRPESESANHLRGLLMEVFDRRAKP